MSTVVPRDPLDKIGFYENHNGTWTTHATALGTSTTEMGVLTAKTTAARDAYDAQQQARTQARSATLLYHEAVREMGTAGSDVIKKIKAKAAVDGLSVYALAEIPAPGTPQPVGPPGTPTDFSVKLTPGGVLHLAWKCVNPPGAGGTIYQVARQLGLSGEMQIIGASGQRKFADPSVPAGTALVTYRIQALRSTVAGTANEFTVKFGGAGGAMTAQVVSAPKLAA
jgi:hypothetical protein